LSVFWYWNLKNFSMCSAQDLWFAIIDAQIETGTPYMLYKDTCNRKSNQQNLGTIRSSNLCTEIIEVHFRENNFIFVSSLHLVFGFDVSLEVQICECLWCSTLLPTKLQCVIWLLLLCPNLSKTENSITRSYTKSLTISQEIWIE
jgi:hypothetical protein